MITKDIPTVQIHKLTQAQYDTAKAAGNIDENAIYLTPDEGADMSNYYTKEEIDALMTVDTAKGV